MIAFLSLCTVASASDDLNISVSSISEPSTVSLSLTVDTTVVLNWTRGIGADTTLIRRRIGSYPTSVTDGDEIYNGTGETFTDVTVVAGNTYYYRFWSFNETCSIYSSPVGDMIVVDDPIDIEIRDITIINNIVSELNIVCIIENKANAPVTLSVNWSLIRTDTSAVLDSGNDTVAINAEDEVSYYISPQTDYVGTARISIWNQTATASRVFSIVDKGTPPGVPPGNDEPPSTPPRPPSPLPLGDGHLLFLVIVGILFLSHLTRRKHKY